MAKEDFDMLDYRFKGLKGLIGWWLRRLGGGEGSEEVWTGFKKVNKMWWNVPYFEKKS